MKMRVLLVTSLLIASAATVTSHGADAGDLSPRKPLRKRPTESLRIPTDAAGNYVGTGRLVVKFNDSIRARAPRTASTGVTSLSRENMRAIDELLVAHGVTIRQAINKEVGELAQLELRAAAHSRKAQPDLAGLMYIEGPKERLTAVARALNQRPEVEFVYFEQEMFPHTPTPMPAPGVDPPACGEATNDCYVLGDPPPTGPNCSDAVCCELVGQIAPFCTAETGIWDQVCVDIANLFCEDGDRCEGGFIAGSCTVPHGTPGCSNSECCNLICADFAPICCELAWDDTCSSLATQNCVTIEDGPTPDFSMDSPDPATRFQKYMTPEPSAPGDAYFDATGMSGDGLTLSQLEALGQTLLEEYGIGTANGARGLGIRVGVVEHSAYVTGPKLTDNPPGYRWHEDLEHVIPEPNQTIITIVGGILNPNHGTATLGQIVAADNGIGITGIARDAEGYFFPIVSVEEGGRLLSAMAAAVQTFEAGDVLNFSIGPGAGTLVSDEGPWILVRLATDLGITCCISAGNSCVNLDSNSQANGQDSGAIIVGACFPGTPGGQGRFCRLPFSNFCRDCEEGVGNVHIAAWGSNVMTTGYGDLFAPPIPGTNPPEPNAARSYTLSFNGTSAAAPIISGLVACLQGLAKQFYGVPLPPETIRGLIIADIDPQCDSPQPPGQMTPFECAGDFDAEQPPNWIKGFPKAFESGILVFASDSFGGSSATDVKVITGTHLSGNLFSIRQEDNQFLIIRSTHVIGGKGQGFGPAITYLLGGQTTDLEVLLTTFIPREEVAALGVEAINSATQDFVLEGVYAYNWSSNRWTLLPTLEFTSPGGITLQNMVPKAEDHVGPAGQVYVRIWTVGLGAVPQYDLRHDLIRIVASEDASDDIFGDGGEG